MKIKIKIEKKHIFLLGILTFILAGVLLVNAVMAPGDYPSQYHNGDRVLVDVQKITRTSPDEKSLQNAISDGDLTKKQTRLVITSFEFSWNFMGETTSTIGMGDYDVCFLEKFSFNKGLSLCDIIKENDLFKMHIKNLFGATTSCRAQCWKFEVT